jgi:2-keto-4-pentenoate hydratase/2-oxohepta-3-ene-1,7-dioic acid hydratase in catechol pathway
MKLVTFRHHDRVLHGWLPNQDHVAELGDGDLTGLLWSRDTFAGWQPPTRAVHPIAAVDLLAPLLSPAKLIGAALNYQEHVTESGAAPLDRASLAPRLFLMPPTALTGPDTDIDLPDISRQVDWEAELAVVIGRTAKAVAPADALDFVAGYTIGNDISARSVDYGFPRDTTSAAVGFFDWLAGKWPDGFAPIGPYLLTADEIIDPQDLAVELRVNGVIRQQASTKDMIFTVAELVSFASRLMTLRPGDVMLTGTPAGVGATTGEFLESGDVMAVSITGLGTLTNRAVRRSAS